MHLAVLTYLWITMVVAKFASSVAVEPTEIKNIENCKQKHSCQNNSIICKCDDNCPIYGDCCSDSVHVNNSIQRQKTSCNKEVLLKIQCPSSWENEAIRHKCENYSEVSDPLSTVPVTSSDTAVTYRNYYCAICDGVTKNFVFWTVIVKCPIYHTHDHLSVEYLRSHLQYNSDEDGWGIWLSSDRKVFRKCFFDHRPNEVEEKNITLRSCMNMISECPLAWANKDIAEQCTSNDLYVPVFVGIVAYRNKYCAVCHDVDFKTLSCLPQSSWNNSPYIYGDVDKLKPSKSNSINAEFRIASEFCNTKQIYDPFVKKCRYVR